MNVAHLESANRRYGLEIPLHFPQAQKYGP